MFIQAKAIKRCFVTCLICLIGAISLSAADKEAFVLKADKVLIGDGRVVEKGMVLIIDQKIAAVGEKTPLPKDCKIIDLKGAVICPGLVDLYTSMGCDGDHLEKASSVEPDAKAIDLFDPFHPDFAEALKSGITTAFVAPSPGNVVSGCAVAVKTKAPTRNKRVLLDPGPMVMTMSSSCFQSKRSPTSRMGAMEILRQALKNPGSHTNLTRVLKGELPCFFAANQAYDVKAALKFAKEFNLRMSILGGYEADQAIEELSALKTPVVLGPYDFTTPERALLIPAALAEAKVPVAFTSLSPARTALHLRLTAALAVGSGLDREIALAAMTSTPAQAGGVSHRVGLLAPGLDADLAVFTSHPTNLSARVLRVYINGELVFKQLEDK